MSVQPNEIRTRETADTEYYVLGENIRKVLLCLIKALKEEPTPKNWNEFDADALATMDQWLHDDRDFNKKQWVKFSKMLKKLNVPHTLPQLAVELNWTWGDPLSAAEMHQIMEQRRTSKRKQKVRYLRKQSKAEELFQ
jgi:hypothetical protein